jgi:hypothetical protein
MRNHFPVFPKYDCSGEQWNFSIHNSNIAIDDSNVAIGDLDVAV